MHRIILIVMGVVACSVVTAFVVHGSWQTKPVPFERQAASPVVALAPTGMVEAVQGDAAHKGGAGFEKLPHLAPATAFSPADFQRESQAYCVQVVQVASPVASGQCSFQITVEGPDDRTAAH